MIRLRLLSLAFLFGALGVIPSFAAGPADYTGHYELADAGSDWSFSLDVTQTGLRADISFSAAMNDGSGAAPDADGQGAVVQDGALHFTFKDSFDNEGTGILTAGPDGYRLKLEMTKVVESRPLRFYGDLLLKKTAAKPASS